MTADGDGVVAEKRALRRELLAVRRALPPEEVAAGSAAVVTALRALPELTTAPHAADRPRDLLLYAADPDEVSLDALIAGPPPGWRVLLPRVEDGRIVTVPCPPGASLVTGHRGIREPAGPAEDTGRIAAVVVPGVAFTPDGARLGRGAGMYDRLLPRLEGAVRIGVCLERMVRDELPVEAHDAPVDVVVTDASVRRRPPSATGAPA